MFLPLVSHQVRSIRCRSEDPRPGLAFHKVVNSMRYTIHEPPRFYGLIQYVDTSTFPPGLLDSTRFSQIWPTVPRDMFTRGE